MTIVTTSTLAAAILAVMAVSAHAQQGPSRQIQVLPAPGQQAQVQQPPQGNAEPQAEQPQSAPQAEAPAPEAGPAPAQEAAPRPAPKIAPPATKFVEPKFIERPARKAYAGYSGYGYTQRAPNCH